jgi:hypothetical protein
VTLGTGTAGTAPVAWQWYRGGPGDTSQPQAGATAALFTTPPVTAPQTWWVRVTFAGGSTVDSEAARLILRRPPAPLVWQVRHTGAEGTQNWLDSVAYGGGRWLAGGSDGSSLLSSSDGMNFAADIPLAPENPSRVLALAHGHGRWLVSTDGPGSGLFTSTTGTGFTPLTGGPGFTPQALAGWHRWPKRWHLELLLHRVRSRAVGGSGLVGNPLDQQRCPDMVACDCGLPCHLRSRALIELERGEHRRQPVCDRGRSGPDRNQF